MEPNENKKENGGCLEGIVGFITSCGCAAILICPAIILVALTVKLLLWLF